MYIEITDERFAEPKTFMYYKVALVPIGDYSKRPTTCVRAYRDKTIYLYFKEKILTDCQLDYFPLVSLECQE